MQELTEVTAFILKSTPVMDYDRRVVMLTRELGKISAFVRGARRQGSRFMGSTDSFVFGKFSIYAGRNAYDVREAEITDYFEKLRTDFELSVMGAYFCEIADYYSRENSDDEALLKLLYVAFRALVTERFDVRLIRRVYELKAIMINGEFPGIPEKAVVSSGLRTCISHIYNQPPEKIYTFELSEDVLRELELFSNDICGRVFDRSFNSLKLL